MHWGLIGASTIAAEHMVDAIRAREGHIIKTVLSSEPTRGREYAARHDIPMSTDDLDVMLEDPEIDAVYISTTNEKHFSQAIAAIAARKHVLCEKPLAMNVAEAVEMVRAADAKGVVFATNHHLRNAGAHLAIRDLIANGRVGEVLSVRVFHAVHLPDHLQGWRINDATAGGGVILDIVVHDVDTVRFYLGEDPTEVIAKAGVSGMGQSVEDSVMSTWSMPSGVMVQTHESFTHRFAGTGIELHGTEGSIIARGVMTQRPVGEMVLIDEKGQHNIPFSDHGLYNRSVALFANAVGGNSRPAANGVDGAKSLAVALAVREAAERDAAVRVDYGGLVL